VVNVVYRSGSEMLTALLRNEARHCDHYGLDLVGANRRRQGSRSRWCLDAADAAAAG
jgi:hypothetical protein